MDRSECIIVMFPVPNRVLSPNCHIGSRGMMFKKAAAAKKLRNSLKEAIKNEQIDSMPWRKVSVDVAYYHKVNRRRDQDNAVGMLKAAYDGIIDSGLVQDDSPEFMSRTMPTFEIDKINPRVEMTITRMALNDNS